MGAVAGAGGVAVLLAMRIGVEGTVKDAWVVDAVEEEDRAGDQRADKRSRPAAPPTTAAAPTRPTSARASIASPPSSRRRRYG